MNQQPDDAAALFRAAAAVAARLYGTRDPAAQVIIRTAGGRRLRLDLPLNINHEAPMDTAAQFAPTPFQESILEALEGKALRTDALGNKVGDRSRLFRHPGGLKELREHGLVDHHPRLGFFRPDAPPQELSADEGQGEGASG